MGKFQVGAPRPPGGGRKRGTPNKKTKLLQTTLEQLGPDLPSRLLLLLPELPPEKQADVLLELMQYVFPKRKAIEVAAQKIENKPVISVCIPSNGREAAAVIGG